MRLPSTGGKVIKMITYMEMGDTFDRLDTYDSCAGARRLSSRLRLGWTGGRYWAAGPG
jgi:hypothetical protein